MSNTNITPGVIDPFDPALADSFIDPPDFPFYPGLYIFRNATGAAIYIGQSQNVPQRLKEHKRRARWYPKVSSVKVLLEVDPSTRLCAEAVLQLRYRPRYCRAIKLSLANDGTLHEIQFVRGVSKG